MRLPLLIPAAAGVLLLAACTSPSTPVDTPAPAPTTASPTTDPVDGPFAACDDATVDALSASLDGELKLEPDIESYPPYLPVPSCIAYPTDQGISVAFFVGATQEDFETIESAVVDEQGAGVAVTDLSEGVLAAETWESGGIIDLRYFSAGNGVSQDYIQATSVLSNYTPGG